MSYSVMAAKLVCVCAVSSVKRKGLKIKGKWGCCFRSVSNLMKMHNDGYYHVGKALLEADISVYSDRLIISEDPTDPVLIVVVKDDLFRMKLLFEQYRRIGVDQFVILDNGSSDGTLEYCAQQKNTRVYQVRTPYAGNRKEGWVEHVIRHIGVDRWYIVADSDEMLDYPGSETHTIRELIRAQARLGNERLYGYMLDMYSNQPLYSVTCEPEQIPEIFCWFDNDTYYMDEALYGMKLPMGGPRERMVGGKIWAGKCPVFLFRNSMSILSAHFMQPVVQISDTNLCTVLRHYKYLSTDRKIYRDRESQASGFGYTTWEYKAFNAAAENGSQTGMYTENSQKYTDSGSLETLPWLYSIFPQREQH